MDVNEFTKKLYALKIGSKLQVKDTSTFLRVPGGWIYKHSFRNTSTCCFVPYTEDFKAWDFEMELKCCFSCLSTDIVLQKTEGRWRVICENCGANSGLKTDKVSCVKTWNIVPR
jgi:hypothetical protein